ncbi:MAG: ABC transporter substrate-binding protein [bacterium]
MIFQKIGAGLLGLAMAGALALPAVAQEPVRVGLIEPFSGPVAQIGIEVYESAQFMADRINAAGGVLAGRPLVIVRFDNAMNAEKTTQQVKKAIDEGIRFISQGVGSNHALNIIKQLNKHNKRNPEKSVLYLNHSAVTTAFTNELCSFWHFRFDANVDMKVAGLATQMGRDPDVKRIYMINQNYAYGKSFQAIARIMIAQRTNAELVGDDLIVPFGKVLDFTPYVAKIKSADADTVLTGNWGADMVRLVKATADAGLDVQFYSIYGGLPVSINGYGIEAGMAVRMKQITEMHLNDYQQDELTPIMAAYLAKYGRTWYGDRQRFIWEMFAKALNKAGSDDPVAVAYALEGMTHPGPNGEIWMRAEDHQIHFPLVVSTLDDQAPRKIVYEKQNLGVGWKTDGWVSREDLTLPTTCDMKRPT